MRRVLTLYQTSVGKKVVMASSGTILFLFVLGHMVGNLKIYQGAAKFDAYAHGLREFGAPFFGPDQLLWLIRLALGACVLVHIVSATQLTLMSWGARRTRYKKVDDLSLSYASSTMRWGGGILLAFVVYHILHLTTGTAHPTFGASPYANVVAGFSLWWVSLVYVLAMIPLGFHIYHGVWSATQSLALRNAKIVRWRRPVALVMALVIVIGNMSIPIAILTGLVR